MLRLVLRWGRLWGFFFRHRLGLQFLFQLLVRSGGLNLIFRQPFI